MQQLVCITLSRNSLIGYFSPQAVHLMGKIR